MNGLPLDLQEVYDSLKLTEKQLEVLDGFLEKALIAIENEPKYEKALLLQGKQDVCCFSWEWCNDCEQDDLQIGKCAKKSAEFYKKQAGFKEMGFSFDDAYKRDGNTVKTIAIYNKPDDYTDGYIARLYNGVEPTYKTVTAATLEDIRAKIPKGYIKIPRDARDVLSLVETWIY